MSLLAEPWAGPSARKTSHSTIKNPPQNAQAKNHEKVSPEIEILPKMNFLSPTLLGDTQVGAMSAPVCLLVVRDPVEVAFRFLGYNLPGNALTVAQWSSAWEEHVPPTLVLSASHSNVPPSRGSQLTARMPQRTPFDRPLKALPFRASATAHSNTFTPRRRYTARSLRGCLVNGAPVVTLFHSELARPLINFSHATIKSPDFFVERKRCARKIIKTLPK